MVETGSGVRPAFRRQPAPRQRRRAGIFRSTASTATAFCWRRILRRRRLADRHSAKTGKGGRGMKIIVNGEPARCRRDTLDGCFAALGYEGDWLATAVNGDFVPRSERPRARACRRRPDRDPVARCREAEHAELYDTEISLPAAARHGALSLARHPGGGDQGLGRRDRHRFAAPRDGGRQARRTILRHRSATSA